MRKIILLLSVLSVLMLIGCGSKKEEGDTTAITYNKIQVQFQNDYIDVTDEEDIKALEYIFDEANWLDAESIDGKKGWTYGLIAYDSEGDTKKIYVINDKILTYEDMAYTVSKEGMVELIDEISGIDRYAVGVEEVSTEETSTEETNTEN